MTIQFLNFGERDEICLKNTHLIIIAKTVHQNLPLETSEQIPKRAYLFTFSIKENLNWDNSNVKPERSPYTAYADC